MIKKKKKNNQNQVEFPSRALTYLLTYDHTQRRDVRESRIFQVTNNKIYIVYIAIIIVLLLLI